ncbi:hypothetical protein K438DRAFT_1088451 [Mycena galopus ATCC 62051]|nr:hypothetical protein K438DRAFT_1088451 [Mycena galopus ATCC 62051]
MSLHELDSSRAGLGETMLLHFSHDSSHSLSPAAAALEYIVVPRPALAPKSHNVQNCPVLRRTNKPMKPSFEVPRDTCLAVPSSRPCTPENDVLPVSLSRPCTPFRPLPPVLATSPLRFSSFLDDIDITTEFCHATTTPSVAPSLKSESPSPPATPIFRQLSIEIPSVSHPNSPYVPWASPVRRNILRPLTPSSQMSGFSGYSRPYSRSGARAPEPQEPDCLPTHNHNKFLRLSRSFRNLGRTVKRSVKHVKNALRKTTSKAKSPEAFVEAWSHQSAARRQFLPYRPQSLRASRPTRILSPSGLGSARRRWSVAHRTA